MLTCSFTYWMCKIAMYNKLWILLDYKPLPCLYSGNIVFVFLLVSVQVQVLHGKHDWLIVSGLLVKHRVHMWMLLRWQTQGELRKRNHFSKRVLLPLIPSFLEMLLCFYLYWILKIVLLSIRLYFRKRSNFFPNSAGSAVGREGGTCCAFLLTESLFYSHFQCLQCGCLCIATSLCGVWGFPQ